jgi:hypothetical protein
MDVERPCRSTAAFEEIAEQYKFVLDPVIFDRLMMTFGKAGCSTYFSVDADPEFAAVNSRRSYDKRKPFKKTT